MKIYCSHAIKTQHKGSNYYKCNLCPAGWYGIDPAPLVVVGYSDPYDVDKKHSQIKEKDLTKQRFNRCSICHDLIGKRKHIICEFKRFLDSVTVGPAPEKSKKRAKLNE